MERDLHSCFRALDRVILSQILTDLIDRIMQRGRHDVSVLITQTQNPMRTYYRITEEAETLRPITGYAQEVLRRLRHDINRAEIITENADEMSRLVSEL